MKKRRYQKDSVLIKFIFSFLLVLILPVFLFSFAYIRYDQRIYQDKLLKQEQDALDLPLQELEQYIEEMKQIAVQTPLRSYVDQNDLMNYEKAHKLIQMLGRYRGTHSVLEEIAVYYEDSPETIFTEKGTYSQEYYRKYLKNGEAVSLYQLLQTKESGSRRMNLRMTKKTQLVFYSTFSRHRTKAAGFLHCQQKNWKNC